MPFEGPLPQQESKVVQLLRAGKARLEQYGWCKGSYGDGNKSCATGALGFGYEAPRRRPRELSLAADALSIAASQIYGPLNPRFRYGIVDLNDRPNTTLPDILACYDRAIEAELARKIEFGVAGSTES